MRVRRLGLPAGVASCVAIAVWIYKAAFLSIDDPSYFCGAPDPSPVTSIPASILLEDCAAGKTFTVGQGQTVGVDLRGGNGVDTWYQWTDLTVSDGQVLSTISPPARVRARQRQDEVAVYRAERSGHATLSAVGQFCTANGGGSCDQGHLWWVTVRIS